jgi:hypothetical protein
MNPFAAGSSIARNQAAQARLMTSAIGRLCWCASAARRSKSPGGKLVAIRGLVDASAPPSRLPPDAGRR